MTLKRKLAISAIAISPMFGTVALAAGSHAASSAPFRVPAVNPGNQVGQATAATIRGQVAASAFPHPPTDVRVTSGGQPVAESALGVDGSFTLAVPAGQAYQLELLAGGTTYSLVFPRGEKLIDSTFTVHGRKAPFDIGLVQYLAPASVDSIAVGHLNPAEDKTATACSLGQTCVDDAEAGEDVCGPSSASSSTPAAGTPQATPAEAAVAERNLPSELGCDSGT